MLLYVLHDATLSHPPHDATFCGVGVAIGEFLVILWQWWFYHERFLHS